MKRTAGTLLDFSSPSSVMSEKKSADQNILIVDDEEDIRLILKEVLSLPGYNVWTASGGLEAINMIKEVECTISLGLRVGKGMVLSHRQRIYQVFFSHTC